MKRFGLMLLMLVCTTSLGAGLCSESEAGSSVAGTAPGQATFAMHRSTSIERLAADRRMVAHDAQTEIEWNAPREWRPVGRPRGGVLLIHGLGDSPWTFSDIGPALAADGYIARAILLPGHGSKPEDMLAVSYEDWQRVADEQARDLMRQADEVFIGGFSTGANLAIVSATRMPEVAGLLLFSPGIKARTNLGGITIPLRHVLPWVMGRPAPDRTMQSEVRYSGVPTNGLAQFHRSSRAARRALSRRIYHKPVLMVIAAADSVLDTHYLVDLFSERFTSPASRLVWYGGVPEGGFQDRRIHRLDDRMPSLRISQFSHMGIVHAPGNPLYGMDGDLRICRNSRRQEDTRACEASTDVWYADWGYREEGKVHARLTFNPMFEWQWGFVQNVLLHASVGPMASARTQSGLPVD